MPDHAGAVYVVELRALPGGTPSPAERLELMLGLLAARFKLKCEGFEVVETAPPPAEAPAAAAAKPRAKRKPHAWRTLD
jgi:hypothetical protein